MQEEVSFVQAPNQLLTPAKPSRPTRGPRLAAASARRCAGPGDGRTPINRLHAAYTPPHKLSALVLSFSSALPDIPQFKIIVVEIVFQT